VEEPRSELTDRFLRNVLGALARRQPAIRHQALETEFEYSADPEMVWISSRVNQGGHRVTFAATVGNRAYLEVLSGRARSRGKVLLRESELRLVDAAADIARTFEWTLGALAGLDVVAQRRVVEQIGERWRRLGLTAVR
jgi:hypothetical protein